MTSTNVHSAAQDGFTKEAGTYSRGRPDYPAEIAGWLTNHLGLGAGRTVADVGAGTGKFCPTLMVTGANVIAVEPVEKMRQQAQKIAGLTVMGGSAQAIPLADKSLDAIVCAQAFHWFARTEVLDEFARVLRPGGHLGLVWNVRDESVDWVAKLTDIVTPHEGDAPRFYKGDWRKPFPHPKFTPLEETRFRYQHTGSPQTVVIDRFMSVSFIAAASEDVKALVLGQLEELVATHPDLKGRDVVSFPYETLAMRATRLP